MFAPACAGREPAPSRIAVKGAGLGCAAKPFKVGRRRGSSVSAR
jgi:hypothetical protein